MPSDNGFQPFNTPFTLSKYDDPYEKSRIEILRDLIPTSHGESAIDCGCGPGYFSNVLTQKDWYVTALDTDPANIKSAAGHAAEVRLGDASAVLATLPDSHYGLVLALEILEHMPKTVGASLLQNIVRVLKPSGRLIISTPNKFSPEGLGGYYWGEKIRHWSKWDAWDQTHVHIYSSWEFVRLLKASGFVVDKITGYYYRGHLPLIGNWRLPFTKCTRFPFNWTGFNIIVECHKRSATIVSSDQSRCSPEKPS